MVVASAAISPRQPRGTTDASASHRTRITPLPRRPPHARRERSEPVAPMNSRERAALGLAYAFLDGAWTGEGLINRGRLVVGHSRPELRTLVRRVLRAYRRPPWDRVREFAAWLLINDASAELGRSAIPYISPTRWLSFQPAMGEMPWRVPAVPTVGELSHFFGL